MSSEITTTRPCPFCGQVPDTGSITAICLNPDCTLFNFDMKLNEWNRRPLEDDLYRQLKDAADLVVKLEKTKELLKQAIDLVSEININGQITWKFDEQQADPIHHFWHKLAEKLIEKYNQL